MTAKAVDPDAYGDFSVNNRLLRYKGKMVIGSDSNFRDSILQEIHNSAIGGHSSIHGT